MSTKTITKRVALATVVALGAGVLSLVTVSSASANNAANTGLNSLVGVDGTAPAVDVLNIASQNSTTGTIDTSQTMATSGATQNLSYGLVAISDIAGNAAPVAGTTQTAVLNANGSITVYTKANTSKGGTIVVSGGSISAGPTNATINGTATAAAYAATATSIVGVNVVPNSGSTLITIKAYDSGTSAGDLTNTTKGTLYGLITVSVVPSGTAGVVSVAKSGVYYSSTSTDGAKTSDATTGTWSTNSPAAQYANIRIKDAYGIGLASTTGLITATATNGAYVHLDDSTGTAGTQSTAFLTSVAADDNMLTVTAPTFAPLTTVVTVAYNGTTIATKSFTFTGPITKVTLGAPALIALTSHSATASVKGGTLAYADSAGNTIYTDATYYPHGGVSLDAASTASAAIASVDPISGTTGRYDWSCGGVDATYALALDYINTDGTKAVSNSVNVSCAKTATSFTIAWDKSTYTPGSIATLTVKLLDSKGNPAADDNAFAAGTDATNVTVGGGTLVSSNSTSTTSALGLITFSAIAGGTDGQYQAIVKYPVVQTSPSSVTAPWTIASGTASMTDVLKGIVSLIASINKQIAALAKLVAPKAVAKKK